MKKLLILSFLTAAVFSCTKEPAADPTVSVSVGSTVSMVAEGGSISVTVTTNQDKWTYDLGAANWLKATASGNKLEITVEPNKEFSYRTATVTVQASTAKVQFNIEQNSPEPYLNVDVDKTLNVGQTAGTSDVNVSTNMGSWEFELEEASWLSGSKAGNVLKLTREENPYEVERSATVHIYAPSKDACVVMLSFSVLQAELDIPYETTDLSAEGTSNCYIISHKGPYTFKATVRGNGKTVKGLSAPDALSPSGARLVWQTSVGVINSVALDGDKVSFVAGKKAGNALIAVVNGKDEIMWSWHIWRPETETGELQCQDGSAIMNINLGALTDDCTKVGCYGLLYQWGRKDPFPGSPIMDGGTLTTKNVPVYDIDGNPVSIGNTDMHKLQDNNIAFSIANPTVCISNGAQYPKVRDWLQPSESNTALWGNPEGDVKTNGKYPNKGSKTYYDPCPLGWRVPHIGVFQHITESGGYTWATGDSEGEMHWYDLGGEAEFLAKDVNGDGWINIPDYKCGWWLGLHKINRTWSFFPATTRYDGQYAMFMGSMVGLWGNYWYNAPTLNSDGSDSYMGEALSFGIKDYNYNWNVSVSPLSSGSRADAYAIRCIKE